MRIALGRMPSWAREAALLLGLLVVLAGLGVGGALLWHWLAGGAYWVGFVIGASAIFAVSWAVQTASDAIERGRNRAIAARVALQLAEEESVSAGVEHPTPTRGSEPRPGEIDVPRLEQALRRLLDAYRGALRFIERLPAVERREIRTLGFWATLFARGRPNKDKKRVVIRPLVRFFAEAHVRKQLLHLIRVLRVETLGRDPTEERSKTLRDLLASLTEAEQELFGWGRLRAAFTRAPFLPAALAFALAVYNAVSGIDLSSGGAFGKSAAESAQAIGWSGVLRILSILALGGIVAYATFLSPAATLGFKRKRALFLGGSVPEGDELLPYPLIWQFRGSTQWEGFPRENVYQAENVVYDLLGVKKRHEIPVDILLSFAPYLLLWGAVLGGLQAIQESDWGGMWVAVTLLVTVFLPRIELVRRRSRSNNR